DSAAQARLKAGRDDLLALDKARTEILTAGPAGDMPNLTAPLVALLPPTVVDGRSTAVFPDEAVRVQRRAAALEAAELPRTVWNGLGYMWNPDFGQLLTTQIWLEAAGQIFFTLSVGFGVIMVYSSYLRPRDDVVLSGLTASATNEFCEVSLGGTVAIPATFLFLGTATTLDVIASGSSFGLGFNTLPAVFAAMPGGQVLGAVWFFLLFIAGITSSLSMLQPAIAFLEEGFNLRRRASVAAIGLMTMTGALLVLYFSKDLVVLDTVDFWIGSLGLLVLATFQIILFSWVLGLPRMLEEAHCGSNMRIPAFFVPILMYVTPTFLLVILASWGVEKLVPNLVSLTSNPPALLAVLYLAVVFLFVSLMVSLADENWRRAGRGTKEVDQ
ncbi:MAG: hypothetical protein ACRDD1_13745, partial [Planctomycetia bacterium]